MKLNPKLVEYIQQNRQLVLSVAAFISVLAIIYAFLGYTPKYTSQAKVLIRESVLTSRYITQDAADTTSSALTNPILNNMNLLKTSLISDALWTYLKKYRPEALEKMHVKTKADWEGRFEDGSSYIKAKNVPGTDIIAITFDWKDPQIAHEGMKVVLKAFQMASLQINQSEQMERSEYLVGQANEIRDKLAKVRAEIRDFKKNQKTVNILRDTENYSKSRIDFETELKLAQAEASAKRSELARYQASLGMNSRQALQSAAVGGDPSVQRLYDQLYQLKEQQSQNGARYTDKHPVMKQLASQIEQTEKDIQSHVKRNLGGRAPSKGAVVVSDETRFGAIRNMVQAQSESAALAAKSSQLSHYLSELDKRMSQLPEVEATLAKYQDEEAVLSSSLASLEQKAMEAKIRALQSLSNVYVIDPASQPRSPSFPAPVHVALLGVILGLAAGVAAAMLKLKVEEAFGREVLVEVPSFSNWSGSIRFAGEHGDAAAMRDERPVVQAGGPRSPIPGFYSK